jgi:hypothetical protein
MELQELISIIMPYAISGLAAVVAWVAGWLGKKIGAYIDSKSNSEQIRAIVSATVRYVEQIGKEMDAAQKLELAKEKAVEWANAKGVPVSEIEVEILIEAFVQEFNVNYEFDHKGVAAE